RGGRGGALPRRTALRDRQPPALLRLDRAVEPRPWRRDPGAGGGRVLAAGGGVLLSGDTIFVTPGEDRVTFVWSAPNRLPLSEPAVRGVWQAVESYEFDRVYGGWWTPILRSGAKDTVRRSAERYIELLTRGA